MLLRLLSGGFMRRDRAIEPDDMTSGGNRLVRGCLYGFGLTLGACFALWAFVEILRWYVSV